jgi:hypothetical protein
MKHEIKTRKDWLAIRKYNRYFTQCLGKTTQYGGLTYTPLWRGLKNKLDHSYGSVFCYKEMSECYWDYFMCLPEFDTPWISLSWDDIANGSKNALAGFALYKKGAVDAYINRTLFMFDYVIYDEREKVWFRREKQLKAIRKHPLFLYNCHKPFELSEGWNKNTLKYGSKIPVTSDFNVT